MGDGKTAEDMLKGMSPKQIKRFREEVIIETKRKLKEKEEEK